MLLFLTCPKILEIIHSVLLYSIFLCPVNIVIIIIQIHIEIYLHTKPRGNRQIGTRL